MKQLLSETSKFERVEIPPDKYLNFAINYLGKTRNILKSLHEKEGLTDVLY